MSVAFVRKNPEDIGKNHVLFLQQTYNRTFLDKHGKEYFYRYRPLIEPYTFSASCIICRHEFICDGTKRGQMTGTIHRHYTACMDKRDNAEARRLKRLEYVKIWQLAHPKPIIKKEPIRCEKCSCYVSASNYQKHMSKCDGVYDDNCLARAVRKNRDKFKEEREIRKQEQKSILEFKQAMKAQKREEQRQVSRPVIECEKCNAIIALSSYYSHLKNCDGIFDENHLSRALRRSKLIHVVDRRKETSKISKAKTKAIRKNFVDTYKEKHGCYVCEENCHHVIDNHHIYPEYKKHTISFLVEKGTLEAIVEELDKCVCLCRNCHQKVETNVVTLWLYSILL